MQFIRFKNLSVVNKTKTSKNLRRRWFPGDIFRRTSFVSRLLGVFDQTRRSKPYPTPLKRKSQTWCYTITLPSPALSQLSSLISTTLASASPLSSCPSLPSYPSVSKISPWKGSRGVTSSISFLLKTLSLQEIASMFINILCLKFRSLEFNLRFLCGVLGLFVLIIESQQLQSSARWRRGLRLMWMLTRVAQRLCMNTSRVNSHLPRLVKDNCSNDLVMTLALIGI